MARDILIYTTYGCASCKAAGRYLEQHGIPFRFVNISQNPQLAIELVRKTGMQSVPQVFIDGQFIGGYNELIDAHQNGRIG